MIDNITIVADPETTGRKLKPGDAFWVKTILTSKNIKENLYLCCIKCGKTASTIDHEHKKHEDGSVTLKPSVQCPFCPAHYYIKESKIILA